MRLFVALTPPPDARAALHEAGAPLREALPDAVRWTAAEKLHLTVRFLGERDAGAAERLAAALAPAVRPLAPARLAAVGPAGAFPGLARPRVLWLGLAPNPGLDALYHAVDGACERAGLGREGRPWRPHLTLGRVRDGARPDAAALARAAGAVRAALTFSVETVDLMRSDLTPGGARYACLAACPLEGA